MDLLGFRISWTLTALTRDAYPFKEEPREAVFFSVPQSRRVGNKDIRRKSVKDRSNSVSNSREYNF